MFGYPYKSSFIICEDLTNAMTQKGTYTATPSEVKDLKIMVILL